MLSYYEIETRLMSFAHERVREVVVTGDTCVDATVGNGHDTLFLAHCVGQAGSVIGFDIQLDAIRSARRLIEQGGVSSDRISLHAVGHENAANYMQDPVAAVMFNLGYLPGSDKKTITQAETTLVALELFLASLRDGGVLSVMCYPGHVGGDLETEAVRAWAVEQAERGEEVSIYSRNGTKPTAPVLIVLKKQSAME